MLRRFINMKKSRILFLSDTFESNFLRDMPVMAKLLSECGYDITWMSSTYLLGKIYDKNYFKKWDSKLMDIKVLRCKVINLSWLFRRGVIPYIPNLELFRKYNLLHVYCLGSFSSFLGSIIRCLRNKIKMVITTDLDYLTFQRANKNFFYKNFILFPAKIADIVIAFSQKEKKNLINLGIKRGKIKVIPHGIYINKLKICNKSIISNKIILGYIGKIKPIKGVCRLISPISRILTENSDLVFMIIAGPEEDKDYSKKILDSFHKFKNFNYWGSLNGKRVYEFYKTCDIILIPSLSESYCLVALESMAAGKLVIASDIYPINEYIKHGETGYLVKESEQFYEYIKLLLIKPKIIETCGQNAMKIVIKYSWKRCIKKVQNIYKELGIVI